MSRKVTVTDTAYLAREDDGDILLCIGALAYGPSDSLPLPMFRGLELTDGNMAAAFVAQVFTRKFGPDRTTWPDLAVRFVVGD